MKIIFALCFFVNIIYSQNKINLPENNENNFSLLNVPYHSIYVTKEKKIIFDNDTIELYNLKERLLENYLHEDYNIASIILNKNVHFFIDKELKYDFYDKLFTEVSCVYDAPYVILRSNFESDIYKIKGVKKKLFKSFYSFKAPKFYFTNVEIEEKEKQYIEDKKNGFPPIPNENDLNNWTLNSVETAIYTIQQEIIDEQLKDKNISCIKITSQGILKEKEYYPFEDKKIWKSLANDNNVIFITFDINLSYENYYKYSLSKPLVYGIINKNNIEFIELSSQILHLHKKANIKLCNCIKD
jgi:biopolymer transport protein ExbD